jgi:hypothetical protein
MNGANGMSDIEGKAAQVAASECGQRPSFKAGNKLDLEIADVSEFLRSCFP